MPPENGIAAVSHVIQLSLAPVFLLMGIAGMLNVMTSRLARVVDRARESESKLAHTAAEDLDHSHAWLATLSRRAKLINRAIAFCTITALLVCVVVATLFLGAFIAFDVSLVVSILFVAAMASFFTGLVFFLREIFVATAALRIGPK